MTSTLIKAGVVALGTMAFAEAASARCVTLVGGSNAAEAVADVTQMTENAHRWKTSRGTRSANNGQILSVSTDSAYARIGIFSVAAAPNSCEDQHEAEQNRQPAGVLVTSALTCGREIQVVQTGAPPEFGRCR